MQHNVFILEPKTLKKVGAEADKLAMDPSGTEKEYVPDMPEVLFFTKMVNPEESTVLRFVAPDDPGDYPFVCTFPGHWRLMNGTMKVMKYKIGLLIDLSELRLIRSECQPNR